jgi:hypothetical protein
MSDEVPDCVEHTCEICKGVWYSEYYEELRGSSILDPNYCPYCGTKFTTKNGVLRDENNH